MTSFFISGNSTTPQTLETGENGFVTVNGTLYVSGAPAVTLAGGNSARITVMGTIASDSRAIESASGTAMTFFSLLVGETGSVVSTTVGATLAAVNATTSFIMGISNAGLISGVYGINANGTGGSTTFTLTNSGTIEGRGSSLDGTGVFVTNGIETAYVTNSGTITGRSNSIGAIHRPTNTTGTLEVINTGTIAGSSIAILSTGSTIITSSGLIHGDIRIDYGIIENAGMIMGNVARTGAGTFTLRNTGEITGDVTLGNAGGTYDGRGGTVHGTVFGGTGNDTFWIDRAEVAIRGAAGRDVVHTAVSYRMAPDIEVLLGVSTQGLVLTGRARDDEIYASFGGDTIDGRGGNDLIFGNDAEDLLHGNGGDDELYIGGGDTAFGGGGNDFVNWFGGDAEAYGGAGNDTFQVNSGTSVAVNLATGQATITGGSDPGVARVEGFENVSVATNATAVLTGSAGANLLAGFILPDAILGGGGSDTLDGGAGNDTLDGGDGGDLLIGGAGNDLLFGGAAHDRLIGGHGADTMDGGVGRDVFVFQASQDSTAAAPDLIRNFLVLRGTIDLSQIDANPGSPGDDAFAFRGASPFSGTGAQLRYELSGDQTRIAARLDGSVTDDMVIFLDSAVALAAGNFVL